jgi:hypothetical protein
MADNVSRRLMVFAGPLLLGSLFLAWSHQISPSLRARYGSTGILTGVPADPTAWQVYSTADVLMAAVALALLAVAMRGAGRGTRLALTIASAVAAIFTVHALGVAPTNGVTIFDPGATPPRYVAVGAASGPGEVLALIALAIGLAGLLLSFAADPA